MTMGTILKRYRLILCCALLFMSGAGSASAQHYIGVMGGWGGGSARFKPAKETGYEWGLYSGGLSYKFYSDTKYVGAIEIDLMFTQKGFNYDLAFESDESYHRRINAIELPLIWQPHFTCSSATQGFLSTSAFRFRTTSVRLTAGYRKPRAYSKAASMPCNSTVTTVSVTVSAGGRTRFPVRAATPVRILGRSALRVRLRRHLAQRDQVQGQSRPFTARQHQRIRRILLPIG